MNRNDFRLQRNDNGSWSLYAASDDSAPLLTGPADWLADDWTRPNALDHWRAMLIMAARKEADHDN